MLVDDAEVDSPVPYVVTGYGGRGIDSAPSCICIVFHVEDVATCISCHTVYGIDELAERSNQCQ